MRARRDDGVRARRGDCAQAARSECGVAQFGGRGPRRRWRVAAAYRCPTGFYLAVAATMTIIKIELTAVKTLASTENQLG